MTSPTLLLVGCGKMGLALAQGWIESPDPLRLAVLDRKLPHSPGDGPLFRTPQDIPADFSPDIIILAIKPAAAEPLLAELRNVLGRRLDRSALLSVMAGKSCAALAQAAGREDMPVIRTMPNTAACVHAATTGIYVSPYVSDSQKACAIRLMEAVGTVVVVPHEDDLRAITAVSGSGPAYVFLLAELLEKAGTDMGLPSATARQLARSMIYGAGKMLHDLPDDAQHLRQNVTSPNGTTAAALHVFMEEQHWPHTVKLATQAAHRRAAALDQ